MTSKENENRPDVDFADLDIAVAHWHVNAWGGAEYLVTKLAEAVGVDTVYTVGAPTPEDPNPFGDVSFYDITQDLALPWLRGLQTRVGRIFEYALWEDVDWREYGDPDVVLTSGATTRAVITPDDVLHVNYCHSPPRWFYDLYHDRKDGLAGVLARPLLRYLRMRDQTVDPRVDHYFVNSPIIERRLWKYYKRDSEVLYPPINLSKYRNEGDDGYYLHLGRLDEEKGVPAVVEAFAGTECRLVMGGGRGDVDEEVIRTIENAESVEWRGFVNEEQKYDMLANCRAVVFNGRNEDFGIVPIEANASGKACLGRDEGFPKLFIQEGENGYLHDGSPEGIKAVLDQFESQGVDGLQGTDVEQFSYETFVDQLQKSIVERYRLLNARFVHQ